MAAANVQAIAPIKAVVGDRRPDGRARPLVRFIRPSKSCSQRQLSTPAAAEANAPPPSVQINRGDERGHPSVRAIPPRVVANSSGMSRGFATSSQAGNLTRLRDGTTSARVRATVAVTSAMTGLQSDSVNNDGRVGRGLIGTTRCKGSEDRHQQGRQKLVGNRDEGLGQTQPKCGDA